MCGDVELNPGPPKLNKANTRLRGWSFADETGDFDAADADLSSVTQMLTEIIKGQQRISQDIADMKKYHEVVNSRFDALETCFSALESLPVTPSTAAGNKVNSDIQQL